MKYGLFAAIGLVMATPAAAGYRITTIDGPSSPALLGTVVDGINNNGLVSGYYVLAGDPMLGQPPQNYVGFTANTDGSNFTSFSRAGHEQTGVSGINDAGTTVGVSVLTYGTGNGFVRTADGSFTDIVPTFGGVPSAYSEAIGINNAGDIVGFYTDVVPPSLDVIQQYSHGFTLKNGVYSQFDFPALIGFGTQLFSINDSGTITGSYLDNDYGLPHGFVFSPYAGFVVPSIGGEFASSVGAVNAAGSFGFATLSPNPLSPTGFAATAYVAKGNLFDGSGVSYTPFDVPGAFSTEIFGINNRNDLTGYFIDGSGIHGFVAQAVPEPASWAMLIAGFGLVGAMQRRRREVAA
jgi:hypothetical protein